MASNLNDFSGNYEELSNAVINSNGLIVVIFHAEWCPTCKFLLESFPAIAKEFPKVAFFKANIDEGSDLVAHFGICSVPQILFMKAGTGQVQQLGSVLGADLHQIKAKLQQFSEK